MIHFSSVEMCLQQAKLSNIRDDLAHSAARHVTSATKNKEAKAPPFSLTESKM